MFVLDLLV